MLVEKRTLPDRRYRWFPVRSGTNPPFDSVAENCDRATYLLLWNEPSHAMLASQAWELKKVERATDAMGRAAIRLVLDEDGALLFQQITAANAKSGSGNRSRWQGGRGSSHCHAVCRCGGFDCRQLRGSEIDGDDRQTQEIRSRHGPCLASRRRPLGDSRSGHGRSSHLPKGSACSEVAKGIGDLGKGESCV
jgi:hypothetical protein